MKRKRSALPTAAPISPQDALPPPPKPGPQVAALRNGPDLYEDDPGDDAAPDPEVQAKRRSEAKTARYHFAGHPLHKFSMGRKRLLLDIRCAVGAGPFGKMDSLFGDALRFTWLCLQENEALENMRAGFDLPGKAFFPLVQRFQIAIDRWADANEALITANEEAMVDTFLAAWRDGEVTEAIPESAAHGSGGGDVGN